MVQVIQPLLAMYWTVDNHVGPQGFPDHNVLLCLVRLGLRSQAIVLMVEIKACKVIFYLGRRFKYIKNYFKS